MEITRERGFILLTSYLSHFWSEHRTSFDDDLPDLLSSMTIIDDGKPIDPAVWQYWSRCTSSMIDERTGFDALMCFLRQYQGVGEGKGKDITRLLSWIQENTHAAQTLWIQLAREMNS